MCGRYATSKRVGDLAQEFDADPGSDPSELEPDYNVAPTTRVPAIVARPPRDDKSADPARQLRLLTWGLVPSWAKDRSIGSRLINARVETAAQKPSFRRAFAARRALIPADGYYEWYAGSQLDAKGKPRKQPFFIHPSDGSTLAMAGLYEIWHDDAEPTEDADSWLWTCTILTTTAEDSVGRIHDRMPMLVEPASFQTWLDPRVSDVETLHDLLVPAAPGRLEAYPVSTKVNSVRNNGPHLIDPIQVEDGFAGA